MHALREREREREREGGVSKTDSNGIKYPVSTKAIYVKIKSVKIMHVLLLYVGMQELIMCGVRMPQRFRILLKNLSKRRRQPYTVYFINNQTPWGIVSVNKMPVHVFRSYLLI